MIADDRELTVTQDRITRLQQQVAHLRRTVANPANYRAAAAGFLAEIDRMQREVREFLSLHPSELAGVA
ncbi:hypothetical protein [Urbifossiella limnaea]|uniref:Uncharacterized protein n=1 Tax=Urbifossiella limnaea TaxID=2528023 RepID=A0A517Y326_9BACT|nr:hypothetical protein [Urbifossiella limnaea]QDU24074.1 hypothetical protein ETAA1_60870 [Urbifossiella limnaea]